MPILYIICIINSSTVGKYNKIYLYLIAFSLSLLYNYVEKGTKPARCAIITGKSLPKPLLKITKKGTFINERVLNIRICS